MPEPVSTAVGVCLLSYAVAQGNLRGKTAVSSEAQVVRDAVTAVIDRAEQSQALFGEKAFAISKLLAMANECSESGWDGEGAYAVNPIAVLLAENFIRALPNSIPLPEIAPEPDGSIALDWIPSQHRLFSISLGTSDRLAYAWQDGSDKGHAVARFDGEQIPQRIIDGINAIVNHGYVTLRTA
jgi:hypothetical protein